MSSGYSYDEQGQFFPIFILTLTSLITLPLTYTLVSPAKDLEATAPRIKSDYKPEHDDILQSLRQAQKRKQRRVLRTVFVLAGWALMAFMVYLIVTTQRTAPKIWNPYDILGISDSSTEQAIKKRYKTLSRTLHPDKARPDAAKNETVESLNTAWVDISKAYQALTDEEVRNNYIQYGHPDGKQSFSIGIALPPWIIAHGNEKYVIFLYTALLGVLLPYLVGSWWYGSQRMSKEGVLMESANNLFRAYVDSIDTGGVITALSVGKEYEEAFKGDKADSGLATIESRIASQDDDSGMSTKDKHALVDLDNGVRRKALALLWAYLGRVELGDDALNRAKYEVAPVAHSLNRAFSVISQAFGHTDPIVASFKTSQHLVQAIHPKASPLLQLPHFTPAVARAVDGDRKGHTTVQQFMELPDAQRRSLVVGKGLLSDAQYKSAVGVARQLPYFQVAKAFFKVTGEKFIIPSSLVTLVVKGRIVPPGSENVPAVNPLDLEDVDPAEDDVDAFIGRKSKVIVKAADGKPVALDKKPVLPPLAHAPYFTRAQAPTWSVFLTDAKQGKMAVPPFHFTHFDQPIFGDDGKPTFNMQTLKAQFAAPPQPGHYTFVMHVMNDSYVGFDTTMEVTLVVEHPSKAAAIVAEDEISEPEEDSLAGQMSALKGGSVPGTTKPRKKPAEEDSDEESGTDDDEADDTSETNTDTEDEGA
ncbi:translocation protein sec63 [Sodiomyces alkalinus F11]|uniref:Translocation protein sec63 n=1 Tax=Sodiomyces alkalinus (strain CBS 110278 / VKM F-3762 / F11) TaxID=1314773 RepID=A0A3N2PNP1_SODAK|nr:translocation protein sec63 [Sodiomyces alkalinus F11]ROT36050.1 translocation protein sec63 [Sodiomyces alkalinus F11]